MELSDKYYYNLKNETTYILYFYKLGTVYPFSGAPQPWIWKRVNNDNPDT